MSRERLWAPWRIGFLTAEKPSGCFLCAYPGQSDDAANHVLERGQTCFVCLNLYPYTAGHILVAPYRHLDDLTASSREERAEAMDMIAAWTATLRRAMAPDGFNVGLNLGRAAGAALENHIHFHLVPRWNGDHNFMSVMTDMRVIHQSLRDTYELLQEALS